MTLFREEEELADAIEETSLRRNKLDRIFIEKDYWVTQVLRAMHEELPGGFVLKGGTSLSKGYDLITRFSENVDVLIVPVYGMSIAERETFLLDVKDGVARRLGVSVSEHRKPGRGKRASRGDYLRYPSTIPAQLAIELRSDVVLLETGFSEGHEPAEMVTIRTLIGESLDVDESAYDDLKSFPIRALDPSRTLIEKLCALHHYASQYLVGNVSDHKFGRHYFDIDSLLNHGPTRSKLVARPQFDAIVTDVERISGSQYGGVTTRPSLGYAHSPAFSPDDSGLKSWLLSKYKESLTLVPAGQTPSGFKEVLHVVQQHSALL